MLLIQVLICVIKQKIEYKIDHYNAEKITKNIEKRELLNRFSEYNQEYYENLYSIDVVSC